MFESNHIYYFNTYFCSTSKITESERKILESFSKEELFLNRATKSNCPYNLASIRLPVSIERSKEYECANDQFKQSTFLLDSLSSCPFPLTISHYSTTANTPSLYSKRFFTSTISRCCVSVSEDITPAFISGKIDQTQQKPFTVFGNSDSSSSFPSAKSDPPFEMFLTNDLERPNKIDERIPLQMNKPIIHSSEPKACHSKSFNNPSKGDEGPLIFEDDFKKDAAEQKTRKPYDAIVMVGYEMLNEFRSKMTDENNSNNEIHNCSKILEGSEKKSTNNNFNFAPGICEFAFNDKMEIEQDKPFNMGQQCSASALLQTSDSLSSYKSTGSLATSISSGLSHSSSSSSQALDQHVLDGIIHWKPSQFAQQQICSDSVCIIEGKRVSTYLEVQKKQMMENWKKQEIEMKKKIEELCLKIHDGKEEKCAMEQFGDEYHSQAPKTENKSDCLSDVSEIQLLQRKKQEKIVETYKRKMLRKRVKEAIRFWRMFDVWVKNDWFAERGIVEGDAETYEEQELWEAAESEELGRMRKPAKFEWAEDRDTEGVTLEEMKNYLKGVDENGACDKSESLEILIRRAEDSIKKEIERNEKSCVERCFEIKQKRLLRKTGTSIKWKNVNTLMGESTGSNERDKNVVAINKFDTENADATKPNELDKQMDRGMLYQSSVADLHLNEDLNIKGLVTRDAFVPRNSLYKKFVNTQKTATHGITNWHSNLFSSSRITSLMNSQKQSLYQRLLWGLFLPHDYACKYEHVNSENLLRNLLRFQNSFDRKEYSISHMPQIWKQDLVEMCDQLPNCDYLQRSNENSDYNTAISVSFFLSSNSFTRKREKLKEDKKRKIKLCSMKNNIYNMKERLFHKTPPQKKWLWTFDEMNLSFKKQWKKWFWGKGTVSPPSFEEHKNPFKLCSN